MENGFHIFDDFYNSNLTKDHVNNILKKVKNMGAEKNAIKKTNDDFNEHTGDTIEDVKPFDIAVAVANAKARQQKADIIMQCINMITIYINNKIKERSLDGYRFCFVDVNNILLNNKFNILTIDQQQKIINYIVNKYKQCGYKTFTYFKSEFCKLQKRMIKISW